MNKKELDSLCPEHTNIRSHHLKITISLIILNSIRLTIEIVITRYWDSTDFLSSWEMALMLPLRMKLCCLITFPKEKALWTCF